jgi:ubiquinone/menaquinone biosynthesis C-methylase UbiE
MTEVRLSETGRSKRETRNIYDRLSRWYDLLAEPSEKSLRKIALGKLDAKPGEYILDIGSGTGQALISLAQTLKPAGNMYGLDVSKGMNEVAQNKLIESSLRNQVVLITGDAVCLPFHPKVFDGIFMSFTLELFATPTIPMVLKECQRVMRSNGRMCVVSLNRMEKPGLIVRLYQYMHHRFPWIIDCRPIDVSKSLESAGFNILEFSEMSLWGLPVAIVLCRFNCH